jgi:hypothetical protein
MELAIGNATALSNIYIDYENKPYPSTPPTYGFNWAAYQITICGIKYSLGKHFGLHSEIGWGIKGLYNLGADIKF